jgi:hypothetical protein
MVSTEGINLNPLIQSKRFAQNGDYLLVDLQFSKRKS